VSLVWMPVEAGEKTIDSSERLENLDPRPRAAFSLACREVVDTASLAVARATRWFRSWRQSPSGPRKSGGW